MPPDHFHIPGRYHPAYSPLGRLLRRRLADERQADAAYLTAVAGLAVGLVLAVALAGWGLSDPAGFAIRRLPELALGAGLTAAVTLVGRQPAIYVACGREALRIRRGRAAVDVPYAEITAASTLTPVRFHRHHARYAATRAYVNRMPPELLLLATPRGPVVLGLAPSDARAFLEALDRRCAAGGVHADVGVDAELPAHRA